MKHFTVLLLGSALSLAAYSAIPLFAADPAPAGAPASEAPVADRARALADQGAMYLKSKQNEDGGWQGKQDPPGITALALRAVARRRGAEDESVKKGLAKLLKDQQPDGGIYNGMLANYNTAIAISALSALPQPEAKQAMDRAVGFLKGLQITDKTQNAKVGPITEKSNWFGGTNYGGNQRPDLSNTQMFVEALHDAGLKPDDPAYQNALKFIQRTQNRSESNDQPWAGDDGGFIYTPADGGNSNAGEFVGPDGKRQLRSYGLMTYAGLKSMVYAGLTKDDPRVKAAWGWITKNFSVEENPGMRLAGEDKAKAGMYYYYLTMARALHAYGEPIITDPKGVKHDWREELVKKIALLQKEDASWVGEKSWMEHNPILATSYIVLALDEVEQDLKEHPVGK